MQKVKSFINKFLKSTITNDERRSLNDTIDANPLLRNVIKEELYTRLHEESENFEPAFLSFQNTINSKKENLENKKSMFSIRAAASIIFLVSGVMIYKVIQSYSSTNETLIDVKPKNIVLTTPNGEKTILNHQTDGEKTIEQLFFNTEVASALKSEMLSSIYVPKGMTYTMKLADGTVVHLNADTELQFPAVFNENIRKVSLKGEGFFEVVSNKKKPFVVVSNNLETKVYGTKFNISNYKSNGTTDITLIEGSVGVTDKKQFVESRIVPNEMFSWNKTTKKYSINKVDVNDKTSWLRGLVVLNNSSLLEMIPVIERKFDIEIEVLDTSLKSKKFSGKLSVNTIEELQAILNATNVFSCQYYANDKKLLIK